MLWKEHTNLDGQESSHMVTNLGYKVVMELTKGLKNKGHVIVMDNFFTSVQLFQDLAQ